MPAWSKKQKSFSYLKIIDYLCKDKSKMRQKENKVANTTLLLNLTK